MCADGLERFGLLQVRHKLKMQLKMKKLIFMITTLCVFSLLDIIRCQQRVAQQCLTQAVANQNADTNLNPRVTNRQSVDPTDATIIHILESICSNIDSYTQCFGRVQNVSQQDPADFFLGLLFKSSSIRSSYQGFCNDIQDVEARVHCLRISPPVQRCHDNFNNAVNQITLPRTHVPINVLRTLACNISVVRYSCEINSYRQCDARLAEIMSDFLYGGLPVECQAQTGVTSLYTQLYGGAEHVSMTKRLVIITPVFGLMCFSYTSE